MKWIEKMKAPKKPKEPTTPRKKEECEAEVNKLLHTLGDRNYLKAKVEADIQSITKRLWEVENELKTNHSETKPEAASV